MALITLTRGMSCIIDDIDAPSITRSRWQAIGGPSVFYAGRTVVVSGRQQSIKMHRLILDAPPGSEVDHVNGNGLDNRRANLRICTHAENMRNQSPQPGRSSAFKGIDWYPKYGKWRARIGIKGRSKLIGYFESEVEAALAYDREAKHLHGPYFRPNFQVGK